MLLCECINLSLESRLELRLDLVVVLLNLGQLAGMFLGLTCRRLGVVLGQLGFGVRMILHKLLVGLLVLLGLICKLFLVLCPLSLNPLVPSFMSRLDIGFRVLAPLASGFQFPLGLRVKLLILLMLLNEFLSLFGLFLAELLSLMLMLAIKGLDLSGVFPLQLPSLIRGLIFLLLDLIATVLFDLAVLDFPLAAELLQFLVQEPVSLPFFPRFSSRSRSSASARKLACCRIVVGVESRRSINALTRSIVSPSKIDHAARPKIASR